MKFYKFILVFFIVAACQSDKKNEQLPASSTSQFNLKYAKGFNVESHKDYKIINITQPWPNAKKSYTYLLASKDVLSKMTFAKDTYDAVVNNPIEQIVVTSTTHIPSLELLGVENKLVGFPGSDYVSSEKTRERIDNGKIRELGKNEGINTEVLLEINPDVVIGFGVDGVNKTFQTIKKANIPVLYNGFC